MRISLLTLPYELREQSLTPVIYRTGSIKMDEPIECKAAYIPPISQVCRLLRKQAIQVFYKVNTFTLVIDPEAVSSMVMLFLSRMG